VCRAKKGGLALHFGVESAVYIFSNNVELSPAVLIFTFQIKTSFFGAFGLSGSFVPVFHFLVLDFCRRAFTVAKRVACCLVINPARNARKDWPVIKFDWSQKTTRTRFHHAVVFPTPDAFDHPDVSRYHPARLHHHPFRARRTGRTHAAASPGFPE
ncbi:hypothetical protein, partial [Aeromonas sp.]|uniref:hypothetical protein n=1 Tax=Aeromonas sp. TaxID=647 RepID=UPI003D6B2EFD